MLNVTNRVNVWDVGLLTLINDKFTVLLTDQTSILQVKASSHCVATNSEEHSVIFIRLLLAILSLPGDLDAAIRVRLFELGWRRISNKFGVVCRHMCSNLVSHLLIESSQEDRPHHDSGVITESGQETCTFKSHVRGTNNKSLAWRLGQHKHIITGNTEILGAWNLRVRRASTSRNHNILCCHLFLLTFGIY